MYKWERYYLCFGVIPFDESHTSLNLATWLKVCRGEGGFLARAG